MAASMKLAPRSAAGRAAHSRRACAASALPLNEPAQRVGSRRALLAGLALTPALVSQFAPAWALIPDDEDEEMVKKAKANRKRQLEADKVLQRQFMAEEGLVDRQLEGQLVPLEKGVIRLAQTGSQLEKGDAKAVSAALNEAWLADFTKSAQELSATDASKASLKGVLTGIDGLRSAANSNDVKSTKKAYVALVSSLSSWADAAKLKVPGL